MQARRQGGGGGGGGRGPRPPRKKSNFRKNKPPSPLDSFQSQFIAVLQSTNFFNAKCRLKHPISRNFSGGLRPLAPAKGLAPRPLPQLARCAAALDASTRFARQRPPPPPPKKKPGYVPDAVLIIREVILYTTVQSVYHLTHHFNCKINSQIKWITGSRGTIKTAL